MTRKTGTVARFNDEKGFGIIRPDDGGRDVLMERSQIAGKRHPGRTLAAGQRVSYTLEHDPLEHPLAENVEPLP